METNNLTIDQLRERIYKGEAKDPLVYLEAVMVGQDPTELSAIYDLVVELDEFSDGEPSRSDWAEVLEMVTAKYKYRTTPASASLSAAKSLAEYLHPKRKQIDISETGGMVSATAPLTTEEILLFKETFNDEF